MPTRRSRSSASASPRKRSASRQLVAHIESLLAGLGPLTSRPMFGGHGLYCGGQFFGFVLDDTLYLKADAQSRHRFTQPFVWQGRPSINYYRAPAEALESPDAALEWAREALAAALRSRKKT